MDENLQAEYLPLPTLHSPIADGTSEMISNLLTSVLPNMRYAKTVAVTISDTQWEDGLWDRDEVVENKEEMKTESVYVYAVRRRGHRKQEKRRLDE